MKLNLHVDAGELLAQLGEPNAGDGQGLQGAASAGNAELFDCSACADVGGQPARLHAPPGPGRPSIWVAELRHLLHAGERVLCVGSARAFGPAAEYVFRGQGVFREDLAGLLSCLFAKVGDLPVDSITLVNEVLHGGHAARV